MISEENEFNDIVNDENIIDVFTNEDLENINTNLEYQLIDDDILRLEEFLSSDELEEW